MQVDRIIRETVRKTDEMQFCSRPADPDVTTEEIVYGGKNMQFIITAYDGKNMFDKRMEVRPRHLEGMAALSSHIICAGGILDEESRPKGSVLVVEFQDRDAVEDYLANEPYILEHVWEKVEVESMNVVILGGEKVGK